MKTKSGPADTQTVINWKKVPTPGHSAGIFGQYNLVTLGSFEVMTKEELRKLYRVGGARADALEEYLIQLGRRFRKKREPFCVRAEAVYGSIHEVPCEVAANVYGRDVPGYKYVFYPEIPFKRAGWTTLGDLAVKGRPASVKACLMDHFSKDSACTPDVFEKHTATPFVNWLKAQKVWST